MAFAPRGASAETAFAHRGGRAERHEVGSIETIMVVSCRAELEKVAADKLAAALTVAEKLTGQTL